MKDCSSVTMQGKSLFFLSEFIIITFRTPPSQNKPRTPPLQWNSYQHQANYYNQQHQQKHQYQQQLQQQLQQQIQQNQHHYDRYEDIQDIESNTSRHKHRQHRKVTSDPMAEVKQNPKVSTDNNSCF